MVMSWQWSARCLSGRHFPQGSSARHWNWLSPTSLPPIHLDAGGGPDGAACAMWAHRLGMRTLLVKGGPAVRGLQLRNPKYQPVDPEPAGKTVQEVAASLQAHLQERRGTSLVNLDAVLVQ